MTDAQERAKGWTTDRPAIEGWYWFKCDGVGATPVLVYLHPDEGWTVHGQEVQHQTLETLYAQTCEDDGELANTGIMWCLLPTPEAIAQVEAETLRACHAELRAGMMCSCCLRVSDWCADRLHELQQAQRAKEGKG